MFSFIGHCGHSVFSQHRTLTKTTSSGVLGQEVPRGLQSYTGYCHSPCYSPSCLPESDDKTLLMKTAHTLVVKHKEANDRTEVPAFFQLASFHSAGSFCVGSWGRKKISNCPSWFKFRILCVTLPMCEARYASWCNHGIKNNFMGDSHLISDWLQRAANVNSR